MRISDWSSDVCSSDLLDVPANTQLPRPVHALTVSSANAAGEMYHLAHRITLARGAGAMVILQNIGLPGAERFATQSLGIDLADGAQLTLIHVQDESRATTQWLQTSVNIGRDARRSEEHTSELQSLMRISY